MSTQLEQLALATLIALAACARPETDDAHSAGTATPAATTSSTSVPGDCTVTDGAALTGTGIAGIKIREDADAVRRRCNVIGDTALQIEGQLQPAMKIALNGYTILAEVFEGEIYRLRVTDPGLYTSDSLHVGTPARQLAAIPGAQVTPGEGNFYVFLPNHCGLSFGLVGLPPSTEIWTIDRLAELPDSARVGLILVTASCLENGRHRILWDTAG